MLNGPSGWDIEGLLTTLANVTGAREADQHLNCYKYFEDKMDEDARRWTYYSLLGIVENLPCRGARRQYAKAPFWKCDGN